jgi:hypothetical protein
MVDKKRCPGKKCLGQKHMNSSSTQLSSAFYLFCCFILGACGSLPNAWIWWEPAARGGGIVSSPKNPFCNTTIEKTSVNHGVEQLWPPPWPVTLGHPDQAHLHRPHTMANNHMLGFGVLMPQHEELHLLLEVAISRYLSAQNIDMWGGY